jgi:hypothetical protein
MRAISSTWKRRDSRNCASSGGIVNCWNFAPASRIATSCAVLQPAELRLPPLSSARRPASGSAAAPWSGCRRPATRSRTARPELLRSQRQADALPVRRDRRQARHRRSRSRGCGRSPGRDFAASGSNTSKKPCSPSTSYTFDPSDARPGRTRHGQIGHSSADRTRLVPQHLMVGVAPQRDVRERRAPTARTASSCRAPSSR